MNRIFLGKPSHWALWIVAALALGAMGWGHLHVRMFPLFIALVGALALGALGWIVLRHRPGDVITREPMEGAALPGEAPEEGEGE